jgi:hypothetical protein
MNIHIRELNLRNGIIFNDLNCINIDQYTLALETPEKETILVFKHAINGCDGIPFDKLEQPGNPKLNQVSHLMQWSNTKAPLKISIGGNEIEATIWNGSNNFMLFIAKDKFVNKQRIDYIKGPKIKI